VLIYPESFTPIAITNGKNTNIATDTGNQKQLLSDEVIKHDA